MTIRLCIISAHNSFYKALQAFLPCLETKVGHRFELVGSASDMMLAKSEISTLLPDLVICDLGQPEGVIDGLTLTRWTHHLRSTNSQLPPQVVLCSLYSDDIFHQASREAGAVAFLVKDRLNSQLPLILKQLYPSNSRMN